MINKAKLALIAAVAAVTVVSPAFAQMDSASPFETKASVQGVAQSSHFSGQRLADHQFRHQRAFWSMAVVRLLRYAALYIRL